MKTNATIRNFVTISLDRIIIIIIIITHTSESTNVKVLEIALHVPSTVTTEQLQHYIKVNQSHYRPEVPRGYQEVKVPRLRNNDPE